MPDNFSLRDVWEANFQRFEDKIDALQEDVSELKRLTSRVNELEFTVRILKWVGTTVTGVVLALAIPAMRAWLGL